MKGVEAFVFMVGLLALGILGVASLLAVAAFRAYIAGIPEEAIVFGLVSAFLIAVLCVLAFAVLNGRNKDGEK